MRNQTIEFKKLNGLKPTVESCTAKVYEEIGELMQLLGKFQKASGEQLSDMDHAEWIYKVVEEILDGGQALSTLLFTLAEENNIDIEGELWRHEAKMVSKGYMIGG